MIEGLKYPKNIKEIWIIITNPSINFTVF